MKKLTLRMILRFLSVGCLMHAAVGLPSVTQAGPPTQPAASGLINAKLTLTWPPTPPDVQNWFNAAEEVSQGQLLNLEAPMLGRSGEEGETIYDDCQMGFPAAYGPYPFGNDLPLQSSGFPSFPIGNAPFRSAALSMEAATTDLSTGTWDFATTRRYSLSHWVRWRMDLAGNHKHYWGKSFQARFLHPFDQNTGLPAFTHDVTEEVGAIRVLLWCDNAHTKLANASPGWRVPFITATLISGDTVPNCGDGPYWNLTTHGVTDAFPGQADTVQAAVSVKDLSHPAPNPCDQNQIISAIDETLLVRAGNDYNVHLSFRTGSYGNGWGFNFGDVDQPSGVVHAGEKVTLNFVVPDPTYCDCASPPCLSAIGTLGLCGANFFLDPLLNNNATLDPAVEVFLDGNPFVNKVTQTRAQDPQYITLSATKFTGHNYEIMNIFPFGYYRPQALLYCQPNHCPLSLPERRFEFMDTPDGKPQWLNCPDNVNFDDLLVICPGYVCGKLRLEGPDCSSGLDSTCLQWITDGNQLTTDNAANFWQKPKYVSYASATGGRSDPNGATVSSDGGGQVFADMVSSSLNSRTVWEADYEMWLGGLKGETSIWDNRNFTLFFRDPNNPNVNTLTLTDHLAVDPPTVDKELTVVPGSDYTHDAQFCMSEITMELVNVNQHQWADPQVAINGGFVGTDPLNSSLQVNYAASGQFNGTPFLQNGMGYAPGNLYIRFCVPQGTYDLAPSVAYQTTQNGQTFTGRLNFPPLEHFGVGCGKCISVSVDQQGMGPAICLNTPPCVGSAGIPDMVLSGSILPGFGREITSVSYTLNGDPPVPIYPGPGFGINVTYPLFTVIPEALFDPCDNVIILVATDNLGGQTTKEIHVAKPPVITQCPPDSKLLATTASSLGCQVLIPSLIGGVVLPVACSGATISQNPAPNSGTWGLGPHEVIFTAQNICGSVTCTSTVTVVPFLFRCPDNITNECSTDQSAIVSLAASVTSPCCPNVTVTFSLPNGTQIPNNSNIPFPIGVTTVTCTVSGCGYTETCSFTVTVNGHDNTLKPPVGRWAIGDGGAGTQLGKAIAVDAAGNSYVAGTFSGVTTFDPLGSSISLTSGGGEDVFLAKYDTDGHFVWVRQAGGAGQDQGLGVAVDANGNCFVTGFFHGPATFSDAAHSVTLPGFGGSDIFLAKYDSTGRLLWVNPDGGPGGDAGEGVAVDSDGNAYVTGVFTGQAQFGPFGSGPVGPVVTKTGNGTEDCFLIKYNGAGFAQWMDTSTGTPGMYSANGRGVAVNAAGKVWITGIFSGDANFGSHTVYGSGVGNHEAFVAHYSGASWAWTGFTISGGNNPIVTDGRAIGVDNSGNCYFTAYYGGSTTVAGGSGSSSSALAPALGAQPGYNDFLVASFDASGTPRWQRSGVGPTLQMFGPNFNQESRGLAVNGDGDVYITGFLGDPTGSAPGGPVIWLAHLDASGFGLWTRTAGNILAAPVLDNIGDGVALDPGGCIYFTGGFAGHSLVFDGISPALNSAGATDLFVAKYCPTCDCQMPFFIEAPVDVVSLNPPTALNPAVFTAVAGGSPTLKFCWYHYNVLINPGGNDGTFGNGCFEVETVGNVSILKVMCGVTGQEAGSFYVEVKNECCLLAESCGAVSKPVWILDRDGLTVNVDTDHQHKLKVAAPPGVSFQIQFRDDLKPTTPWQILTNVLISGTNNVFGDPHPNPTNRFYRLAARPGPPNGFQLFMNCQSDKTVECGTSWSFDTPAPFSQCSGTNVTVTELGTVTNGVCPVTVTRTWRITDACTDSALCSQTVTVRDTTPPDLICASNKTVASGASASFDLPSVNDVCCGTNTTLSVLSTVTNGVCPTVVTRTWLATDCCSNSIACSQAVTILCSSLTNRLVAYWPMDTTSANLSTPDLAGHYDLTPYYSTGHIATNFSASTVFLTNGFRSNCVAFVDTKQTQLGYFASPGDQLPINKGHASYTVSLWVNAPPGQPDKRIFCEANITNSSFACSLGTTNGLGKIDFFIRQATNGIFGDFGGVAGKHTLTAGSAYDNTWHMITLVQQDDGSGTNGVRTIYLDAVPDPMVLPPKTAGEWNLNNTSLGGWLRLASTSFVTALIDDVAIWDRALSPTEVQELYTHPITLP